MGHHFSVGGDIPGTRGWLVKVGMTEHLRIEMLTQLIEGGTSLDKALLLVDEALPIPVPPWEGGTYVDPVLNWERLQAPKLGSEQG